MDNANKNKDKNNENEEIEWETELNREALDFIINLYDGTFKDLVNR